MLSSEGRLTCGCYSVCLHVPSLQAMAMSTSSSDGLSSSVTDDLFFILQKCLG